MLLSIQLSVWVVAASDYYAGFDIQGRGLRQASWSALLDNDISIGFWGAHKQSLIHQSATDNGTSDIAIQKTYLKKQELMFSGGYNNPGLLPAINTDCNLANASLKSFHGLATFLTAKSTIQQVPFVSRFNLGNGLSFRKMVRLPSITSGTTSIRRIICQHGVGGLLTVLIR